MFRLVLAVVAGLFAWVMAWFGGEQLLAAIWPTAFGAHQRAFQAAIENGGAFTADTTMLLVHIVLGYAPLWYHLVFTAMLVPMTIVGGRLKAVR